MDDPIDSRKLDWMMTSYSRQRLRLTDSHRHPSLHLHKRKEAEEEDDQRKSYPTIAGVMQGQANELCMYIPVIKNALRWSRLDITEHGNVIRRHELVWHCHELLHVRAREHWCSINNFQHGL